MSEYKLPELPAAVTKIGPCMFGGEPRAVTSLYTAAQMRDYALAALRQQDDPMAEYELWTCRHIIADTDAANDTALDALDAIWEKLTPEQREEANALGSRGKE